MRNIIINRILYIATLGGLLTMCGTAPVTPPAEACSPRLDGEPTQCPEPDAVCLSLDCPKLLPRENIRGEIDIWNPHHFIHMEQMFIRNARRNEIEKNMTLPDDAINKALMEYLNEG